MASSSRDFQHLTAVGAIAERMNRTGGDMHECASGAHRGLSTTYEPNLALRHVERLIPFVAVWRRPRPRVARLHRDLLVRYVRPEERTVTLVPTTLRAG